MRNTLLCHLHCNGSDSSARQPPEKQHLFPCVFLFGFLFFLPLLLSCPYNNHHQPTLTPPSNRAPCYTNAHNTQSVMNNFLLQWTRIGSSFSTRTSKKKKILNTNHPFSFFSDISCCSIYSLPVFQHHQLGQPRSKLVDACLKAYCQCCYNLEHDRVRCPT